METGEVTEALCLLDTIIPTKLDAVGIQALVNKAIIYCSKMNEKNKGKECLNLALDGAVKLDNPELVLLVKRHAAKFNIILD